MLKTPIIAHTGTFPRNSNVVINKPDNASKVNKHADDAIIIVHVQQFNRTHTFSHITSTLNIASNAMASFVVKCMLNMMNTGLIVDTCTRVKCRYASMRYKDGYNRLPTYIINTSTILNLDQTVFHFGLLVIYKGKAYEFMEFNDHYDTQYCQKCTGCDAPMVYKCFPCSIDNADTDVTGCDIFTPIYDWNGAIKDRMYSWKDCHMRFIVETMIVSPVHSTTKKNIS